MKKDIQTKIIFTYLVSLALIVLIVIILVVYNWNVYRERVRIQFRVDGEPKILDSRFGSGFQKFPAKGALLGESEVGKGKMAFTLEATNRRQNKNEIRQLEIDVNTLEVTSRHDLKGLSRVVPQVIKPAQKQRSETQPGDSKSSSGPIWLKNDLGYNTYYFYQFETKRANFEGDYIWTMNDPDILKIAKVEKGPAVIRLGDLPKHLSTDIINPSAGIYLNTPGQNNICLLGEFWYDEARHDPRKELKTGDGYAVCYIKNASGKSSDSPFFRLRDKFRLQMDMASIPGAAGIIAFDTEDKTGPLAFFPGKYVESASTEVPAIDFSKEANSPAVILSRRIEGRTFETAYIVSNRADKNGYYAFWIEMQKGYDWPKAKGDILTGRPGLSYFTRSLMVSISNDRGKTFSEPIRASGQDYFLDGCFTTSPDGDIYVLYLTAEKKEHVARMRVLRKGESEFEICYVFSEKGSPGLMPVEPLMKVIKTVDGKDRVIIISKFKSGEPYGDYYALALDEIL